MKNIRIGKDISLTWTLTVDGASVDLSELDLTLYLIAESTGKKKQITFTADDDVLSFTYYGTEQTALGVHRLTLWLNKGQEGQSVLDESYAFNLVPRTEMEGDTDEDNLTTATVELSGDLTTGTDEEYAQLEARVTDIEDEGLITATTIGAGTISLDNSEGDAVVTLPAATSSAAGLMSAAQVSGLASKADAADVPTSVEATESNVLLKRGNTTLLTLPAANSNTAGVMSAEQERWLGNILKVDGVLQDSDSISLLTIDGYHLINISAASTTQAGVMSAAQAATLASAPTSADLATKADATSVPDGASATTTAVTLQNNGTDLFALPASSTTQAGAMSAAQATALNGKADAPTLSVQSTAPATLSPTINTYTRIDSSVGTMSVTLPAIDAGTFSALSIAFTSDTTPAVTFTTADGKSIVYASDFAIDAETTYEVSALFNGANWVLAYVTFD